MPTNITHLELKNFLLSELTDLLGLYTFTGGTLPAIALLPHPTLGMYFPPDDWSVSGLEAVIIRPVPSPKNSSQLIAGDLAINYHWRVVLKDHDQKSDLYEAMDTLMIALSQIYTIVPESGGSVPATKKDLVVASAFVDILDPTMIVNE